MPSGNDCAQLTFLNHQHGRWGPLSFLPRLLLCPCLPRFCFRGEAAAIAPGEPPWRLPL